MGTSEHTLQRDLPTSLNVRLYKRVIGNNDDTERLPPQRTENHMLHHNKWVPKICGQEPGTVIRYDINTKKGHQSHLREGKRSESKMTRYAFQKAFDFRHLGSTISANDHVDLCKERNLRPFLRTRSLTAAAAKSNSVRNNYTHLRVRRGSESLGNVI